MADFRDLEALAKQDLSLSLTEVLAEQTSQYQDAIPEEILDLLEEAAETYVVLAPTLPERLRNSACKEIDFFMRLYQDKIKKFLGIENPQFPQKITQLLGKVRILVAIRA